MNLVRYPNPILYEDFTDTDTPLADIRTMYDMLVGSCNQHRCIGLAANQLGLRMNFCIVGINNPKNPDAVPRFFILIKPKILEVKGRPKVGIERCRSMPHFRRFRVIRRTWVKVEFIDINGMKTRRTFRGWGARVFLHVYDILRGLTIEVTGKEINPIYKDDMEAKSMDTETARKFAQLALDMHTALGIKHGDDPYKRIEELVLVEESTDAEDAMDAARIDKLESYLSEPNKSISGPSDEDPGFEFYDSLTADGPTEGSGANLRSAIDSIGRAPAEEPPPEGEPEMDGDGTQTAPDPGEDEDTVDAPVGDEISDEPPAPATDPAPTNGPGTTPGD